MKYMSAESLAEYKREQELRQSRSGVSQRAQFASPAALKAFLLAQDACRQIDGDYRKGGYRSGVMRHARH